MTEISKEIMKKREEQLEGLSNLFTKVFDEYYKKYKEFPNLKNENDVNIFVAGRSEIWHTIQGQDLVLSEVARIALKVLEEKKRKIEIGEQERAAT